MYDNPYRHMNSQAVIMERLLPMTAVSLLGRKTAQKMFVCPMRLDYFIWQTGCYCCLWIS